MSRNFLYKTSPRKKIRDFELLHYFKSIQLLFVFFDRGGKLNSLIPYKPSLDLILCHMFLF